MHLWKGGGDGAGSHRDRAAGADRVSGAGLHRAGRGRRPVRAGLDRRAGRARQGLVPGGPRGPPAGGRPHRVADGPGAAAAGHHRLTGEEAAVTVTDLVEGPEAAGGAAGAAPALGERVRRGGVGRDQMLAGPFGPRRVTYADWTASGRALGFVEDAIRGQVLPWYANTHTESSGTGRHTTRLREQARQLIHQAVGGTDQDLVVFCGSGATAAVAKLVGLLELAAQARPAGPRPVVFVGPFEHHSNLLPWRESAAEVVAIGEDAAGQV